MDSSYTQLGMDDVNQTEMIFEQAGVSQKFTTNIKHRKNILIPGRLSITSNRHGKYIEWKASDKTDSPSKFSSGSSCDNLPIVHGSSGSIGFKAGKEEAVEFLPDPTLNEFRRPIQIELPEIRSYVYPQKTVPKELIFIACDGTTYNPFVFERGSPDNILKVLENYISFERSKQDKCLYTVKPKLEREASRHQITVAELLTDPIQHYNNFRGFVSDLKNEPYNTGLTVLGKILNGDPIGIFKPVVDVNAIHNGQLTDSEASSSNGRVEVNTNRHEGMDADCTTNEEGYEVVFKPETLGIELGPRPKTYRGQPLSQEQWLNYMDNEGRLTNFGEIRRIIFRGGVDIYIRKHVWPFLLGVYECETTYEQRRNQFIEKTCCYNRMKMQWATISEDQEERFHAFRDFKSLIDKDVARTDRTLDYFKGEDNRATEVLRNILMTYMMYNFNLGYVQGMSDILSPILMEIQDEILSFWIFVKFMDIIHTNFEMSQEGMQRQLKDSYTLLQLVDPMFSAYLGACDASNMYFQFRWLLIWFKREFTTGDTMTLWEALWTKLPGINFQLFIGLSILVQHRTTVMENKFGLSEILRHVNDLSMKIDLSDTLTLAEGMYQQVMDAEDKLPNNLRVIVGLPEMEEPPTDATLEIVDGNGDSVSYPTSNGNGSLRNGGDGEENGLESQYEMGVSQFM